MKLGKVRINIKDKLLCFIYLKDSWLSKAFKHFQQNLPRALSSPGTTPNEAEERETFLLVFEATARQAEATTTVLWEESASSGTGEWTRTSGCHPDHPYSSSQSCVWGMTGHLKHSVRSYHRASASFFKSSPARCKFWIDSGVLKVNSNTFCQLINYCWGGTEL